MKKFFVILLIVITGFIGVQNCSGAQNIKPGDNYRPGSMPVVPYPLGGQKNNVNFDWNKAKPYYANRKADYVGYYYTPKQSKQQYQKNIEEEWFWRGIGFLIIGICVLIIRFILAVTKNINQNYVEPARKKHANIQERYRKYLKACDKRGKRPLSYKQWKFAYIKDD